MNKCTPPHNDLPDYCFGRLLFFDENKNPGTPWVVYDGQHYHRFPHRGDAERYCQEKATSTSSEVVEGMLLCQYRSDRLSHYLDKIGKKASIDIRLQLEQLAVYARRIADALDTIISQTQ